MVKLNKTIILALSQFYSNRAKERNCFCDKCNQRMPQKTYKRDKEQDLKNIKNKAALYGWDLVVFFETFWFSCDLKSGNSLTIIVREYNYLTGGTRKIKKGKW